MAPPRRFQQAPRKGSKVGAQTSPSAVASSKARTSLLQQSLASIFSHSFTSTLSSGANEVHERTQRLKQRLYARDFAGAFKDAADLEIYALRWSPPRALAYHDLFCSSELREYMRDLMLGEEKVQYGRIRKLCTDGAAENLEQVALEDRNETKIVAFGAGPGAELVAIAGTFGSLQQHDTPKEYEDDDDHDIDSETVAQRANPSIQLQVVDFGPWQQVLSGLEATMHAEEATLSAPLPDASKFRTRFTQRDILALARDELATMVSGAKLVTLLFTLNELYATSKSKSTALLLHLTDILQPGALLLVVDSPGSYATVDVGGSNASTPMATLARDGRPDQSKAYPMHWLLDHTLLEAASNKKPEDAHKLKRWKKMFEDRSRWFRLPSDLKYPLQLEDMRYQVHAYQRI